MNIQPQEAGFTLIELIIFIVVTGILATTILLSLTNGLQKNPALNQRTLANLTAEKCMEWFVGQRHLNSYSAITCPSSTVPSFCTAPSGYSISVNISCTTISSDSNYKTIVVTVSGNGGATLTSLIGAY